MKRPPMIDHRARMTWSALGVVLLLLIGCAGDEAGNPLGKNQTDLSSSGDPQVSDESPAPTPTPSTNPTTAPTATPAPSPRSVSVLPTSVTIWLPATETAGEALGKPFSAQLTATVLMSDGSTHGQVTWRSLSPQIATVDAAGLVTAVRAGVGEGPWSVAVEAVAPDGTTKGTRHVSVHAEGGVDVIIR